MAQSEAPRAAACPECGKPAVPRYRPFCSSYCRDRDLLRWLDGCYAVPVTEVEADEDQEPER